MLVGPTGKIICLLIISVSPFLSQRLISTFKVCRCMSLFQKWIKANQLDTNPIAIATGRDELGPFLAKTRRVD